MPPIRPKLQRLAKALVLLLLCFVVLASTTAATYDTSDGKKKKRLALLTASLPWGFGPYQAQMHELSLLLKDEYDICWVAFSQHVQLPPGEYKFPPPPAGEKAGVNKAYLLTPLHRHLPGVVPPSSTKVLDHITILGSLTVPPNSDPTMPQGGIKGHTSLSGSHINTLAKQYQVDIVVTLFDITRLVPDVPFEIPVVGWIPLHSGPPMNQLAKQKNGSGVRKSSSDYWTLRHYHCVAALAPSTAKVIDDAVGSLITASDAGVDMSSTLASAYRAAGKVEVAFLPHIIDRTAIAASAARGLELLERMSVAHADSVLSGNPPILDLGQERTMEVGHERSLFGKDNGKDKEERDSDGACNANKEDIDENTFVVLLQGGNYDGNEDRKGWDTSIQAFVRFYEELYLDTDASTKDTPANTCRTSAKVHLLIHSMESYRIEADNNRDADAPPQVMPDGHLLHKYLHETGLPRSTYTIDTSKHAAEVVAAYKARAHVCLHPSKVEGFGMNVLECQAVGTPVITTNYTAMGDFTKLGRSVKPRQMIRSPKGLYELALPDVEGIVEALRDLYRDFVTGVDRKDEVAATNKWLDDSFSPKRVVEGFSILLGQATMEFQARSLALDKTLKDIPMARGYVLASGYHAPIADWDAPWTLMAPDGLVVTNPLALHRICWEAVLRHGQTNVMVLPVAKEGEMADSTAQQFDENTPLLIRTYMVTALQGTASRRLSLVALAMQQAVAPKVLPPGLAVIVLG